MGSSEGDHHSSAENYCRMLYYEALDLVIEAITKRFNQSGYRDILVVMPATNACLYIFRITKVQDPPQTHNEPIMAQ